MNSKIIYLISIHLAPFVAESRMLKMKAILKSIETVIDLRNHRSQKYKQASFLADKLWFFFK